MSYTERVESYIKKHNMIQAGSRIAVGVSGGADSVCLLLILSCLSERMGFDLLAVNVEHGIRGRESAEDSDFVESLCREKGIPCLRFDIDVPALAGERRISTEEAARDARYEIFQKVRREGKADLVAVAHNMDDNAETIIHNLARGTSLTGLAGIHPVRDGIIRPLLCLTRTEIEAFLREADQPFRTDSTNLSPEYTRNRIRQTIIPGLKNINPRVSEHILEMCGDISEVCAFIEKYVSYRFESMSEKGSDGGDMRICILLLKEETDYIQKEIIRKAMSDAAGGARDIGRVHVDAVWQLTCAGTGRKADLPMGLEAEREYDTLVIRKKTDHRPPDVFGPVQPLTVPGKTSCGEITLCASFVEKKGLKITKKTYTKLIDYDKIRGRLFLRHRRSGDMLVINDRGGSISLKDYFINEKIPRGLRDSIWILCDEKQVIWVVGYRLSEAFKVSGETSRVLELKLLDHHD